MLQKVGAYLRSYRLVGMLLVLVTDWPRIREVVSNRLSSRHLKAFVSTYRRAVVAMLEHIHADRGSETDRFLVLTLPDGPNLQTYVQCIFLDDDQRVLCEVDSGFYANASGQGREPRLRTEVWIALSELGFPLDPGEGNFQAMIDLKGGRTLNDVATTMLTAFYLVCGARLGDDFTWYAPLIDNPEDLPAICSIIEHASE